MRRRALEIVRVARSDSLVSRLHDAICSNRRVIVSPTMYKHTAVTDRAKREMVERSAGVRLFTSWDKPAKGGAGPPHPCELDPKTLGKTTHSQVPKDIAACRLTYAGNWSLMVERRRGTARFMAVCGFFDCGGGGEAPLERDVKHVNLCEYGRSVATTEGRTRGRLKYLFSGTFAAGRREDGKVRVFVNARSGTWALAKRVLALAGHDIGNVDDAVAQFARPRVARVVRKALGKATMAFSI